MVDILDPEDKDVTYNIHIIWRTNRGMSVRTGLDLDGARLQIEQMKSLASIKQIDLIKRTITIEVFETWVKD